MQLTLSGSGTVSKVTNSKVNLKSSVDLLKVYRLLEEQVISHHLFSCGLDDRYTDIGGVNQLKYGCKSVTTLPRAETQQRYTGGIVRH
jgi:hypothetical protein